MKNNPGRIIYALSGGNGAGKTTYAQKMDKEKRVAFFALDKTIKEFNEVIKTYEDYMSHFQRALDLISSKSIEVLKNNGSVVFDFAGGISSRPWLKQLARAGESEIEIFHLEVPLEERRRRIRQRNIEKNKELYFFHMSDESFDRQNQSDPPAPPAEAGVRVTRIDNR